MCSTDVYCSKQTGSSSTIKETITHHFFVSGIGQKKKLSQPKFVAAQKNVVKTETQQTFGKWIARFYYFRHLYSAGSVCIAHNNCEASCPSIWATLSALLINILLGSFQLFFCIKISLQGEIIPFSGVCHKSGRLHYPRRRRWWLHALTDRLLCCANWRPAATSSRRASFSALASANSCIFTPVLQHHADASACQ